MMGATDANASGATRIAGSINFKRKYAPNFPRVEILSQADGITERTPAPLAPTAPPQGLSRSGRWPDYQRALAGAPRKRDGSPDRSKADYWWCRWAIERGWSVDEVAERLWR